MTPVDRYDIEYLTDPLGEMQDVGKKAKAILYVNGENVGTHDTGTIVAVNVSPQFVIKRKNGSMFTWPCHQTEVEEPSPAGA